MTAQLADAPSDADPQTTVPLTARPDLGGHRQRPGGVSLAGPALDNDGSQSARPHVKTGGVETPRPEAGQSPRGARSPPKNKPTPRSGAKLNTAQAAAADKLDMLLAADLRETRVPRRPRGLL